MLIPLVLALATQSGTLSHGALHAGSAGCVQQHVRNELRHLAELARAGLLPAKAIPDFEARSVGAEPVPTVAEPRDIHFFEDSQQLLLNPQFSFEQLTALMVAAANDLISEHGDNFDFVGFWTNYQTASQIGLAFNAGIVNDVTGIGEAGFVPGEPTYDLREDIGLGSEHVEAFIMMWNVDSPFWTPGTSEDADLTRLVLAHEFGHRYGVFSLPIDGVLPLVGDDESCGTTFHWNYKYDQQASCLDGADWLGSNPAVIDSVFTYNTDIAGGTYSYHDLYHMGYVTPEELDMGASQMRYMVNANDCLSDYAGPIVEFTSDDILDANGPRVPSSEDEKKHYRIGWVMLHLPGDKPTRKDTRRASAMLSQFSQDYYWSTLGRGTVDNTLPR